MTENYYFFRPPTQPPSTDVMVEDPNDPVDPVRYVQAVFGFIFALLIYFCLLCHMCWTRRETTTREVARNIVKKVCEVSVRSSIVLDEWIWQHWRILLKSNHLLRHDENFCALICQQKVLPHGQSQFFDRENRVSECECQDCDTSINVSCYCCRKKTRIAPASESAKEVLARYRQQYSCGSAHTLSRSILTSKLASSRVEESGKNQSEDTGVADRNDVTNELVIAEEGSVGDGSENVCPICLRPYNVGQDVAWSKLRRCRHVFHYECILPWAGMFTSLSLFRID